jgi:hypothetical protein
MLAQFLRFSLSAWENHFLYGAQALGSSEAARQLAVMTVGMGTAGSIYVLQSYLRSIGREDREEYLEQKLAPDRIAAAAYYRSGFASITPNMIDTALSVLPGVDPIFNDARRSGMSSGFISGTAPIDLTSRITRMSTTLGDGAVSRSEARNIISLLPGARLPIVENLLNQIAEQFPEEVE